MKNVKKKLVRVFNILVSIIISFFVGLVGFVFCWLIINIFIDLIDVSWFFSEISFLMVEVIDVFEFVFLWSIVIVLLIDFICFLSFFWSFVIVVVCDFLNILISLLWIFCIVFDWFVGVLEINWINFVFLGLVKCNLNGSFFLYFNW